MVGKPIGSLSKTPPLVGLAVGIGDGIIVTKTTPTVLGVGHRTVYGAAVAGAALLGPRFKMLNDNQSMSMLTAAATILGSELSYIVRNNPVPYVASPAQAPLRSSGCTSCAQHAAGTAPGWNGATPHPLSPWPTLPPPGRASGPRIQPAPG